MEKLKQYKYIILILLIVLGFAFYWYELRPSIIKKDCYKKAVEEAREARSNNFEVYNAIYKFCLQKKGL